MGHDVVRVFHADASGQCAQRTERADEDGHLAVGWRSAEQLPHDDGEILLADGEFLLFYRLVGLVPIVIQHGHLLSLDGENSFWCRVNGSCRHSQSMILKALSSSE